MVQFDEEMTAGAGVARGVGGASDGAEVAGGVAGADHGAGKQKMEAQGGKQHEVGELCQMEAQAGAGGVPRACACEAETAVDEDARGVFGGAGGDG